jgi:hypothetical protein
MDLDGNADAIAIRTRASGSELGNFILNFIFDENFISKLKTLHV